MATVSNRRPGAQQVRLSKSRGSARSTGYEKTACIKISPITLSHELRDFRGKLNGCLGRCENPAPFTTWLDATRVND
ncbi:MAG: hypothetical protein V4640_04495 [Verrucomicrobiota bacterium]